MGRAAHKVARFIMDAIQIEKAVDPNVVLNERIDRLELNLLNVIDGDDAIDGSASRLVAVAGVSKRSAEGRRKVELMPDHLRALVRLPYANKVFLPGEAFTASPSDAKVLVMTGRAVRVEDAEPEPPIQQPILTRALEPSEPEKIRPGRRKGYLRRDMRSEE